MRINGKGNRRAGRGEVEAASRTIWVAIGAIVASTAFSSRIITPVYARQEVPEEPKGRTEETLPFKRFEIETGWVAATEGTPGQSARVGASLTTTELERIVAASKMQTTAGQDPPLRRFDIPPGPLSAVLRAFQDATGLVVSVELEQIGDLASPGVSGLLTVEQALEELLAGTGLTYRFTAPQAVRLELKPLAESVVVTGQVEASSPKYTKPLRDTPQTVTVVPKEVIEEQGATTLRDVLKNVTGISIQAGEGGVPAGDNLSIRGFNARTDIFVDGVRDFGGYSRDPFNLEQVEVVKGPASNYSGRGSTGGSVNLVSKTPFLSRHLSGSVGGGTGAYGRAAIDYNQPLDGLGTGAALRLNAMFTNADTPGRDEVGSRRWGVAPSLSLGLGTGTRWNFGFSHLGQDNLPDYGIPWVPSNNQPLSQFANQPAPVDFGNFYGLNQRDYEKTDTDLVTAQVEHDFGDSMTLRNLFRLGRTRRDSIITAPRFAGTDTTDIRRTDWKSRDQNDGILANQTDLTARFETGSFKHTLITGLELARETSTNYNRVETGQEGPDTDLFDPNPNDPYDGSILRDGQKTDGTGISAALYAFDTIDFSDKLQWSGSLRWDRFDVEAIRAGESSQQRTDNVLSWRTGLVYKPAANGSLYIGAGTSFNPSAEGLSLATRGGSLAEVEPEKSRSYEAGTKWDLLDLRLSLTAAVFRTEKTNARTPGLNPGDPPSVLDGRQVVNGIEFGVAGHLTDAWSIFGGYAFMDSGIEESNAAAEVGNEFGNTPSHTLSLWSSYRLPWEVEIGGGLQYVGDRFNNSNGTRTAPGYWLVDAMASYRISEHFTLRLNVDNLANERYIDRVGGGHFIPGTGRAAKLTTSFDF